MVGVELVVEQLFAWMSRRAGGTAGRPDQGPDGVLDAAVERLHELVLRRLAGDTALVRLREEAAARGELTRRTRLRVELALEDAVERDGVFARALRAAEDRVLAVAGQGGTPAAGARAVQVGDVAGNVSVGDAQPMVDRLSAQAAGNEAESRDGYPVLVYLASGHHEEFLRAVLDEDPGARLAYRTGSTETAESAVILAAPWAERRVERLRRTLRAAGAPDDAEIRQTRASHRPYLLQGTLVQGPDRQLFEISEVPSITRVGDVADGVLEQYGRGAPHGRPPRVVTDRQRADGSVERLDPEATLHDTGVRDGETLRVTPEATAGGGSFVFRHDTFRAAIRTAGQPFAHPYTFDDREDREDRDDREDDGDYEDGGGEWSAVAALLAMTGKPDLPSAAETVVTGLTRLFLALGPPPEAAAHDLAPVTGGSGGMGGGRR